MDCDISNSACFKPLFELWLDPAMLHTSLTNVYYIDSPTMRKSTLCDFYITLRAYFEALRLDRLASVPFQDYFGLPGSELLTLSSHFHESERHSIRYVARHWGSKSLQAMTMRQLSGLQKNVLSLYRDCLRAASKKPMARVITPQFDWFVRLTMM